MVFSRICLTVAVAFQISTALVQFKQSLLYDEYDFSETVSIPNLCVDGCRIYASVSVASADFAKEIVVKGNGQADMSLYDISKIANPYEKGFLSVQGTVNIINDNDGNVTAPIAVWIVNNITAADLQGKVFDAGALPSEPHPITNAVTVMSAEPFTLRSKTDGPMRLIATLSGFDALFAPMAPGEVGDNCINVISLMDSDSYVDMQISVRSPLISFNYDGRDFEQTKIKLSAEFGKETLDFTGVTFAASPGYIGCSDQKTYRSSLYDDEDATYSYYSYNRAYDLSMYGVFTNDAFHPVIVEDKTNKFEYKLSEAIPDGKRMSQTNDIRISWTRNLDDPDQSFLIWIDHYNEQPIAPSDDDCDGVSEGVCYLIGPEADNWQDAQDICRRSGAKLASIHNSEANSFIRRLAVSSGNVNGLLLGATLTTNKKNFEWIDGSAWNYENFYPEFPMNWMEDCLAMDTSSTAGQWMNAACTSNLPVVCERKA